MIENSLHWIKDVILNEDKCQIVQTQQAATLGIMRNMGFNLIKMEGNRSISEGISQIGQNVSKLWDMVSQPFKKIHNFN